MELIQRWPFHTDVIVSLAAMWCLLAMTAHWRIWAQLCKGHNWRRHLGDAPGTQIVERAIHAGIDRGGRPGSFCPGTYDQFPSVTSTQMIAGTNRSGQSHVILLDLSHAEPPAYYVTSAPDREPNMP
jgi:hypothetical protein